MRIYIYVYRSVSTHVCMYTYISIYMCKYHRYGKSAVRCVKGSKNPSKKIDFAKWAKEQLYRHRPKTRPWQQEEVTTSIHTD